jgi:hypothetical protein
MEGEKARETGHSRGAVWHSLLLAWLLIMKQH